MFNSFAVSRTDGGNEGIAVSYDNTFNQASSAPDNTISTNQTYLILSRFRNVGSSLSGATPGVAEIWALTESQFDSFIESGRSDDWLSNLSNVTA